MGCSTFLECLAALIFPCFIWGVTRPRSFNETFSSAILGVGNRIAIHELSKPNEEHRRRMRPNHAPEQTKTTRTKSQKDTNPPTHGAFCTGTQRVRLYITPALLGGEYTPMRIRYIYIYPIWGPSYEKVFKGFEGFSGDPDAHTGTRWPEWVEIRAVLV